MEGSTSGNFCRKFCVSRKRPDGYEGKSEIEFSTLFKQIECATVVAVAVALKIYHIVDVIWFLLSFPKHLKHDSKHQQLLSYNCVSADDVSSYNLLVRRVFVLFGLFSFLIDIESIVRCDVSYKDTVCSFAVAEPFGQPHSLISALHVSQQW